jgi:hypothetical protein
MNNRKKIIVCGVLLAVLFITSCGEGNGNYKNFDYELRGYWILHELDPDGYDGDLEITSDRITIWGFYKTQTPPYGWDEDRPFGAFTKDIALNGYSEDGKFFIDDRGMVQEGVPYIYWKAGKYPETHFLSFKFGLNEVTMRKER